MKTIIIAAVLVLLAARVEATSLNFNIFFEHHFPVGGAVGVFEGTYTLTDGKLTQFDVVLDFACGGNPPRLCDFHIIAIPDDPLNGSPVVLTDLYPEFGGILTTSELAMFSNGLFPNQPSYDVRTPGPDFFSERYFVTAVSEPPAILLLLAGLLPWLWMKFSKP